MLPLAVLSALLAIGTFPGIQTQISSAGCINGNCTNYQQINTLYCHTNPARFCQCRPEVGNIWVLQVMPCPDPATVFSFRHQVCVHPWMRDDAECLPNSTVVPLNTEIDRTCDLVACGTYKQINTLTCHPDPKHFCQCRPISTQPADSSKGLYAGIPMPCANGTSFSYRLQTCARDELWVNTCP